MPGRIMLLVVALLVSPFGLANPPAVAEPAGTARECLSALPAGVLGVVVLHDVVATEQAMNQVARPLGSPPLPIGTFLNSLPGADPAGELVLGLSESIEGAPALFLLIPVADFGEFVTGLQGVEGEESEIELAGQRLLALHRGRWALLTSVSGTLAGETYTPQEPLVEAASSHFAPESRGAISLIVPGDAMQRATIFLEQSGKTPQELERLRRTFRLQNIRWNQPGDWQELLLAYGPLFQALAEHSDGLLLRGQVAEKAGLELSGALLARPDAATAANKLPTTAVSPLRLTGRPAFLSINGSTGTTWTKVGIELFLGHLASRGTDLGIAEFPATQWEDFRQSVHALMENVGAASLLAVAPRNEEPQLANQAILLEVADAEAFLTSVQELTTDWNRLVENTKRNVELVFDAEPLELAGLKGRRFAVDLPSAFGVAQIPEVRTVLTKLFGNTGEMQIDVLPLDSKRVLLSQFPPETTTELIGQLGPSANDTPARSQWIVEFNPQVFQDWQNSTFRASLDGNIIGWTPRRFGSEQTVYVTVEPRPEVVRLQTTLTADLLKAWVDFVRRKAP